VEATELQGDDPGGHPLVRPTDADPGRGWVLMLLLHVPPEVFTSFNRQKVVKQNLKLLNSTILSQKTLISLYTLILDLFLAVQIGTSCIVIIVWTSC